MVVSEAHKAKIRAGVKKFQKAIEPCKKEYFAAKKGKPLEKTKSKTLEKTNSKPKKDTKPKTTKDLKKETTSVKAFIVKNKISERGGPFSGEWVILGYSFNNKDYVISMNVDSPRSEFTPRFRVWEKKSSNKKYTNVRVSTTIKEALNYIKSQEGFKSVSDFTRTIDKSDLNTPKERAAIEELRTIK